MKSKPMAEGVLEGMVQEALEEPVEGLVVDVDVDVWEVDHGVMEAEELGIGEDGVTGDLVVGEGIIALGGILILDTDGFQLIIMHQN